MATQSQPDTIPQGFILTITDAAAARVREVIASYDLPDTAGLKVGVTEGGCSGLNYDVRVAERPDADQTVYTLNGAPVFVSPFAAQYVSGMVIDWVSSMQESRFTFQNPNATGGCGCGVSFTVD